MDNLINQLDQHLTNNYENIKNFGENNNDIYANLQHNTGSINNRNR